MRVRCLGDGRHGIVEEAYGVDEKKVGIMLEKAYWKEDGSEGGGERVRGLNK